MEQQKTPESGSGLSLPHALGQEALRADMASKQFVLNPELIRVVQTDNEGEVALLTKDLLHTLGDTQGIHASTIGALFNRIMYHAPDEYTYKSDDIVGIRAEQFRGLVGWVEAGKLPKSAAGTVALLGLISEHLYRLPDQDQTIE